MKITGLEIIPASKYLFIRISTDEGIHGTGEAGAWGFLDGVEGVLRRFESYLLGKNPFQIGCTDGIFVFQSMFSYGQRSKCAELLNSYK